MTDLVHEATLARENAVAPFSKYKVGAALRTAGGKVYRGCNVENSTYGLTVCAERVALLSALAAGERKFTAIAVVTQSEEPATPCGPCRQLMWEYCGDIDIFLGNWLPAQGPLLQPFLDDRSVELVRKNLVGAKYTLGVPDYLYEAGLHDFADIHRFRKELGASIYGIEPGNEIRTG